MVTKKKAKHKLFKDLVERVLATFAQGFAGAWLALGDMSFDELFTTTNLKVGFAAGVLALVKGIAASKTVGEPDSASLATDV